MPYSKRRRHNSPSIPQTPYQTLIIPCPNFDPIYQVILLENSNAWNLSPAKEGSLKEKKKERKRKKEAMIEKQKRWNLIRRSSMFQKKRRGWNTSYWETFYRKIERKEIPFPIVQNLMCCLIHTHTSFAFALHSIPWLWHFLHPFTTPFSINHDYLPHKLSIIFLCFYNI
jgi:hypothetical protein